MLFPNIDIRLVRQRQANMRRVSYASQPRQPKLRFRAYNTRIAFSLVELMVVLVILAMLSGVVTISIRSYLIRSKQNVAKVEIGKMMQSLDTFYSAFDRYPTNEEGLEALALKSDEFPEGLIAFLPTDPWSTPYEYRSPGSEFPFEIICFGADKREGGEGANRDITSMQLNKAKVSSP